MSSFVAHTELLCCELLKMANAIFLTRGSTHEQIHSWKSMHLLRVHSCFPQEVRCGTVAGVYFLGSKLFRNNRSTRGGGGQSNAPFRNSPE